MFSFYQQDGRCSFKKKLFSLPCQSCQQITTYVHPFCESCMKLLLHVELKPSSIVEAGLGLFAVEQPTKTVLFRKGDFIAPYMGELITQKTLDRRYSPKQDNDIICPYVISVDKSNYYLDAALYRGPAAYSNHHFERKKVNAYLVETEPNVMSLVARKNIKSGEEIFTNYGDTYWNGISTKFETI